MIKILKFMSLDSNYFSITGFFQVLQQLIILIEKIPVMHNQKKPALGKNDQNAQEINIKNKFKSKNSIEIKSITSQLKSSPPSTSQLNTQFGHHQYGQIKQLVYNFEQSGEVLKLAYLTNSQEVHIDEEALYFLQKYSTFEIAFIAFVGERHTGKSFALDTLLNICCAQGNQFTTVTGQSRQKGIYLWTIPFSSNFKRKIFLIQCSGISFQTTELIRQDEILLDLVNILASTLIVFNPSNQKKKRKAHIFEKQQPINICQINFIESLKKSSERILKDNQPTFSQYQYWPQVLYSVYFAKPQNTAIKLYEQCYSNCVLDQLPQPFFHQNLTKQERTQALNNKLSGINPVYISQLKQLFIEAVDHTTCKQYLNLKYTGNICCKLLINSIKYLNKKPIIKINKIFNSILKELYQASYTYHTELYDDYLKQYFNNQEPLSFDDLLQAFKSSSTYVLDSFNEMIIEECLHSQYQSKLLGYIGNKQELIMEINSKKTKKSLKERIKQIENVYIYDVESIKAFLINLNKVEHKLDHNKTNIIAQKILKYTKNIQQRIIQQRQKFQRETIARLKQEKIQSQQQYQQIKYFNEQNARQNRQNQRQLKRLGKINGAAQVNIKNLKRQIDAQKRYQKEYIVSKQSKKQYAQSLLGQVRELQEKVRENKKMMDEICKDYQYHPDILQLQKKIQQKTRQNRELEKLQQKISIISKNSFLSKNSVLKSNTSIVRSAIQKPKQTKTVQSKPIKRLSKK